MENVLWLPSNRFDEGRERVSVAFAIARERGVLVSPTQMNFFSLFISRFFSDPFPPNQPNPLYIATPSQTKFRQGVGQNLNHLAYFPCAPPAHARHCQVPEQKMLPTSLAASCTLLCRYTCPAATATNDEAARHAVSSVERDDQTKCHRARYRPGLQRQRRRRHQSPLDTNWLLYRIRFVHRGSIHQSITHRALRRKKNASFEVWERVRVRVFTPRMDRNLRKWSTMKNTLRTSYFCILTFISHFSIIHFQFLFIIQFY